MKLSYLLAAVALCLLWPLGTAGAQGLLTSDLWQQGSAPGGYKPLDPPDPDVTARRRSRAIRVRGKPGELPLDHLHIRAWYRTTALTASKIAKSRGVWVGEAPRQNDALNPSIGFGADFVYSFTPLMSLTYSIGYEWFEGGRAAGADFHDFGFFLTSIGPRINFPLGLSPGDWANPEAVPYVRGIIPYVRLGLGLALTSDIDYDEPGTGTRRELYAADGAFYMSFVFGTEILGEHWGVFFELLGVQSIGPLDGTKSPESKSKISIVGFPFTFGAVYRF